MEETPRRVRLDLYVPAEKAIYDAMQEVEKMQGDIRLTHAVIHLDIAKNHVADFVDNVPFKEKLKNSEEELYNKINDLQDKLIDSLKQIIALKTQLIEIRKIVN